ncbi:hypothetical protein DFH11DRAFT_1504313 [Phellopilus nigrolimitatus]|nr:hypothetical protein DFH11DRAFT_1504313 [Phellopilus nigrolimitatus]
MTADVVIVDHELIDNVALKHSHSKTIYVEEVNFVKRCIEREMYYHDKPKRKGMSGRIPGSARTEYSREDDRHLARYLARRLPDKESGGRQGNGVYKELCHATLRDQYAWAGRHSWQSWQNRYKKNMEFFDGMINTFLATEPPHPDGKGEYPLDRRAVGLGQRPRNRRHQQVDQYRVDERGNRIDGGNANRARSNENEEQNGNEEEDGEEEDNDVWEADSPRRAQGGRERDDADLSQETMKKRKVSNREESEALSPERGRQGQQRRSFVQQSAGPSKGRANGYQEDDDRPMRCVKLKIYLFCFQYIVYIDHT